jgi:hypothetical protein
LEELFGLWEKGKKRPWSEISKPYAASTTTAYQPGAKIRFSPNKCGSRATLTLIGKLQKHKLFYNNLIALAWEFPLF